MMHDKKKIKRKNDMLTSSSSGLRLRLSNCDARLDFAGHHDECLLDILAIFSGSFKESDIVMLSELLALVCGDLAGVGHIALVAHKDARYVV